MSVRTSLVATPHEKVLDGPKMTPRAYPNFPGSLPDDTKLARELRRTGTGLPLQDLISHINTYTEQRQANGTVTGALTWEEKEDAFFAEVSQLTSACLEEVNY